MEPIELMVPLATILGSGGMSGAVVKWILNGTRVDVREIRKEQQEHGERLARIEVLVDTNC